MVRTTGSGMGCPDWPKCFGQWVPPTSVEQLPSDYKETNSALRAKKNEKFARYLSAIGFDDTATKILSDKAILEEADFNAQKTWIEYLNRLVGVVIGLLIVLLFVVSVWHRKEHPILFWVSLATLVAVVIQGWFGSIVVSTNLTHWTISVHMALALVIVAQLIYLMNKAGDAESIRVSKNVKWLLVLGIILLLIQVFLGTEVRGAIDRIATIENDRGVWILSIWNDFIVHRSFSWMVLLFNLFFVYKMVKTTGKKTLYLTLALLFLLDVLTGAGLAYFSVPAFLQPIHLLVASVTFGIQFLLLLKLNTSAEPVLSN
jgi:cytochrome c oxidase assembly protein subunit 15